MSREVSAVIALALGKPIAARELCWPRVLQIARWERCASLAWLRSAEAIRATAPAAVTTAWREEAFAAAALGEMWASLTAGTFALLESAGVHPCVMKGLPLSQRLYGDAAARPCSDLDLYVAAGERAATETALLRAGWSLRAGVAPRESCYVTEFAGRTVMLEVHSRLLDDALVFHLPFQAPRGVPVRLAGGIVFAHDDEQLPAFLATHLAKHAMAPLLWFVDLHTLWESLDSGQRDRAWAAARAARASRYLHWAVARTDAVIAAADGSARALTALGVRGRARRDTHNAVRVATLAAAPTDAVRSMMAWALPPALRSRVPELLGLFARRVAAPLRRVGGSRRSYDPTGTNAPRSSRALPLDAGDFGALAADTLGRGAGFWLRVAGSSMWPSIKPGSFVYLTPVGERTIALGDIVLAANAVAGHALHRVAAIDGGRLTLQGDGNLNPDPPIARDSIMALADVVLIDGIPRRIPRPRFLKTQLLGRLLIDRLRDRAARWTLSARRANARPTSVR